jgi:hypothetical protein
MFPHHPPAEIVAQVLKWAGKCIWRLEHVFFVGGCCGVAGGCMVGVMVAGGVKFIPPLVPFRVYAGLTLSVDMVTGLPRTRSCSVFSLLDRIR